jgi:hypothetical protein
MTRSLALVRVGLREILSAVPLVALFVGLVLVVTSLNAAIVGHFAVTAAVAAGDPHAVGGALSTAAYFAAFVGTGPAYAVLLVVPLTRAQATGRVISLLATPAGARRLWLTRAAALWLPGTAAGVTAPLGVLVGLRRLLVPSSHDVAFDRWLLLATFVAVPLAYVGLSLVVNAVALTVSPNTGNVIAIVFYAGGSSLMGQLLAKGGLSPQAFWWANAVLAVAMLGAGAVIAGRVRAERMVLACP